MRVLEDAALKPAEHAPVLCIDCQMEPPLDHWRLCADCLREMRTRERFKALREAQDGGEGPEKSTDAR